MSDELPDDADVPAPDENLYSLEVDASLLEEALKAVDRRVAAGRKRSAAGLRGLPTTPAGPEPAEELVVEVVEEAEAAALTAEGDVDLTLSEDADAVRLLELQGRVEELELENANLHATLRNLRDSVRLSELKLQRRSASLGQVQAELTEARSAAADQERELRDLRSALRSSQEEGERSRHRTRREAEEHRLFAGERVLRALLPALDNLELALLHPDSDPATLLEGVRVSLDHFRATLAAEGLVPVEAEIGEPFQPAAHEAIEAREQPGAAPNTVLQVVERGYILHGRLLRPARVVVSLAGTVKRAPRPAEE